MGGLASSGGSMFRSARSAEDTLNRNQAGTLLRSFSAVWPCCSVRAWLPLSRSNRRSLALPPLAPCLSPVLLGGRAGRGRLKGE